jgi:AcrR family transcriptional regulator
MRRSSEDTKALILGAARERFAADGYAGATIRAIARDAQIDPSMVMRYFGSKDQLFAAAAQFDLALPDLDGTPDDQIGARLAAHYLDRWEADQALRILLRTAVTDQAVAERMKEIFAAQLVPVIARVADAETAVVRAGMVATQVLGMALCRYLLVLPPVAALSREEVLAWIGPTIQRYVMEPSA